MAFLEEAILNATEYVPTTLDPIFFGIQNFFKILSALLGGLFGLYFVFFFFKLFYDRKILNEIQKVRKDIAELKKMVKKKRK